MNPSESSVVELKQFMQQITKELPDIPLDSIIEALYRKVVWTNLDASLLEELSSIYTKGQKIAAANNLASRKPSQASQQRIYEVENVVLWDSIKHIEKMMKVIHGQKIVGFVAKQCELLMFRLRYYFTWMGEQCVTSFSRLIILTGCSGQRQLSDGQITDLYRRIMSECINVRTFALCKN